jgi:hypothetical protein
MFNSYNKQTINLCDPPLAASKGQQRTLQMKGSLEYLKKSCSFRNLQQSFSPPDIPNLPLSLFRERVCKVNFIKKNYNNYEANQEISS